MTSLKVAASVLSEADDAQLCWSAIERAYAAVAIHEGAEAYEDSATPLTLGQRAVLAQHWCIAEVTNGGFLQFFDNPTHVVTTDLHQAFTLFGATESATILAKAESVMAEATRRPVFRDSEADEFEVASALDEVRAEFNPLDARFYELMDTEMYPLAAAYIRTHPQEFTE